MIVRMSGMGATSVFDARTYPIPLFGESYAAYYARVGPPSYTRLPATFPSQLKAHYEETRPRTATGSWTGTAAGATAAPQALSTALVRPPIPAPRPLASAVTSGSWQWATPQPSSGVLPTATPAQTAAAAYQEMATAVTGTPPAGSVATASGPVVPVNGSGMIDQGAPGSTDALISQTPENAAFMAEGAARNRRTNWIIGGLAVAAVGAYLLSGRGQATS